MERVCESTRYACVGGHTVAEEPRVVAVLLGALELGEHLLHGAQRLGRLPGDGIALIVLHALLAAPPKVLDLEGHQRLALEVHVLLDLVACAA